MKIEGRWRLRGAASARGSTFRLANALFFFLGFVLQTSQLASELIFQLEHF
jgi:hypothetical protein